MSIDVTVYTVDSVESSRTHSELIDITLDRVRIFLTLEQAKLLAAKMLVAAYAPFTPNPNSGGEQCGDVT